MNGPISLLFFVFDSVACFVYATLSCPSMCCKPSSLSYVIIFLGGQYRKDGNLEKKKKKTKLQTTVARACTPLM